MSRGGWRGGRYVSGEWRVDGGISVDGYVTLGGVVGWRRGRGRARTIWERGRYGGLQWLTAGCTCMTMC